MYSGTMTNTTAWTLIGYGFFLLPLTLFLNSHLIQEFAGIKKFLQRSVPLKSKTQVCYRTLCQQIADVCESMQSVWKAITCLADPGWEKTLAKLHCLIAPKRWHRTSRCQDCLDDFMTGISFFASIANISAHFAGEFLQNHNVFISCACLHITGIVSYLLQDLLKSWALYLL